MKIDVTILEYPNLTPEQFYANGKKFIHDLDNTTFEKYKFLISELISQQMTKTLLGFQADFTTPSFPKGPNTTIRELNQATENGRAELDDVLTRVITSYITLIRETYKSKMVTTVAPEELKPILEVIISEDGKEFAQFFDFCYVPMFHTVAQDPIFIAMFQNALQTIVQHRMAS